MPDNLGWEITPADYAEIKKHDPHDETPRMLESCNTCGHPRRMHSLGLGDICEVCNLDASTPWTNVVGPCFPIGDPRHRHR